MPSHKLWLLFIAYFFSVHLVSASSKTFRQEVLRDAMKNNLSLRTLRTRIQRSIANVKGSKVFPNNPVLAGFGGVQMPDGSGQGSVLGPRVSTMLSLGLPVGGRWGHSQRFAKSQLVRAKKLLALQTFRVTLRTHQLLNHTSIAWHVWQTRKNLLKFFHQLTELTKKRIKHGSATQLDLQLAMTTLLQARQATLNAALHYRSVKQQLETIVGRTSPLVMSKGVFSIPNFPSVSQESTLLQNALQSHAQIQLVSAILKQAKAGLSLSKAKGIPDLKVSVRYSFEDNNHVVMGGLAIPLPLFWRNQGKIGQSRAQIQIAKMQLVRTKFQIRRSLHLAYTQYKTTLKLLLLLRRRMKSILKQAELLQKGLKEGALPLLKALTAQQSIQTNQLLYLKSLKRAHDRYLALCLAAGILPNYRSFMNLQVLLHNKGI